MARAMNSVWIILGFQFLRRISPWRIKSVFQIPHPGWPKKPGFLSMTQKWSKNTWIPQTTNIETDGQSTRSSSPKMAEFRASIACASSSWTPACSMSGFPVVWGKGKHETDGIKWKLWLMGENSVNHWWKHCESWDISFHGSWCRILSTACRDCSKVSSPFSVGFHWEMYENVWNTFW